MASKEDGDVRDTDGNHPSKGQEHAVLADAAALEKVNLWSKGMLSVSLPADPITEEMLNPTSFTSAC
jgi:hypothetical protein